ncbi:DUF4224 domain-containing protein [Laribacter hongkongensis]|uniref:DUF4224 domain-containing protein n=1 Tax=Laribacter hongkongensis TaxID=168471 RepID=UPI0009DC3EB1|nr:DUF4224 domain-containing protein [Laribacter hongkongensis]MCG9063905.1 DUF4224 domain-containing protein [Laribacter hongkongensis]MCG9078468.1 DUF4224 domain-containing protein [Laribacter hongkongensis]MCG9097803.1 DUF4224 domain-containing protein [Laribacter hongkongensis]MCG9105286.1 DUF4224 domain-containing protein [Laribacter hongkongensis]MCG9123296.1 DUF4224 domain-containing protein [Laribacter hongkongensis]
MVDTDPLFLTTEEVALLTGRKFKSKQIEALRQMLIPFRINANGRPIVTRAAIEGRQQKEIATTKKWQPSALPH